MTFYSSNKEMVESETTDGLITIIRTAMGEGCIHPSHVYYAVNEALDRLKKNGELLKRIHDYLCELIRDNLVDDTPTASNLADDIWDAINIGTETWRYLKKEREGK